MDEQHDWLILLGIGALLLLGFALNRWLPTQRRKNRVERLRGQAHQLAERIKEASKDTTEAVEDSIDTLREAF